MRQRDAADADADGTLAPPELRAFAEAEVARASRPQDEALLRAVASFDSDADGRTTLAELSRALGPLAAND
ncbi:hypothetical protein C0V75_17435 [Tabrizicola sp. TH137]|nr:hypothetical protein C0V75_17435 [Tabrizicola sp. TH137]